MGRLIVNGGKALSGDIHIDGSKNAALPIIFSCIAIDGVSVITNMPNISDVDTAFAILKDFGARIHRTSDTVTIDTTKLEYCVPNLCHVTKIRASSYLIGACLSRFGRVALQAFGGCNFDTRPIDLHIMAAQTLGASLCDGELFTNFLIGQDIYFDKVSVGATVNALILTSAAVGRSRIFGYAKEPHVISLADFLRRAGAAITFTPDYIEVVGAKLTSSCARIIPDMIEAGTYILLSILTNSNITVTGADISSLASFLHVLKGSGVKFSVQGDSIRALSGPEREIEFCAMPYPEFPTDLQPQMAPVLANFFGGRIADGVWRNRFGYLRELSKFGVSYEMGDGFAKIYKSTLHSARATVPDLRGGAALLMCGLMSEGESVIENFELIKRGYGNIEEKLRTVGADVFEIN